MPIFSKKISVDKRQKLIAIWNEGRLFMKGKQEEMLLSKYGIKFEEQSYD